MTWVCRRKKSWLPHIISSAQSRMGTEMSSMITDSFLELLFWHISPSPLFKLSSLFCNKIFSSSNSTNILVFSFMIGRKSSRILKWNVGVSILLFFFHLSPVLNSLQSKEEFIRNREEKFCAMKNGMENRKSNDTRISVSSIFNLPGNSRRVTRVGKKILKVNTSVNTLAWG